MRSIAAIILTVLTALAGAVELRVATFNIQAKWNTTYTRFDNSIGAPGTIDHETVKAVLTRLDADVVAIQEVNASDESAGFLAALANGLGYPHVFFSSGSNTFDTSLRVVFLSRHPFLTSHLIASPPGAKDMTRQIPAVRVNVPGTTRDPLLVSAHLKAGDQLADRFQRSIEMLRLTRYLDGLALAADENIIVLGDFNLVSIDRLITEVPTGLPTTFALGPDISGSVPPINYHTDPISYFSSTPMVRLDPRQLDGSPVTHGLGSVLDLMLVSPVMGSRPLKTEIYNSVLDLSNDTGLAKAGSPLAADTSALASDHFALVADLELDPPVPYIFTAAGQTVSESFAGFPGTYDPTPWTTSGGTWQGADDGSRETFGFRAYGPTSEPSLGYLSGTAGSVVAAFENRSDTLLTALEVSFTAEQWRSSNGGAADRVTVELLAGGTLVPLPALDFQTAINLPDGPVSGGASTPRNVTVGGLAIAPGEAFELRFSFVPGPGGGGEPDDIFINEFHYDNAGADTGEFIEIVTAPGFSTAAQDIDVLLYNGADGKVYRTLNLGSFAKSIEGFTIYSILTTSIQNDTDGIAIVNRVTNQVYQFISYEGIITATDGIAAGLTSVDIGVSQQPAAAASTAALGLTGTGAVRGDFTWSNIAGAHSRGLVNAGQSLFNPVLPPQGIAIDDLAVTFLSNPDIDGDGTSDADEAIFGTDPNDAASNFKVVSSYPEQQSNTLRLAFTTVTGRDYVIECSDDLLEWDELTEHPGDGEAVVADLPVATSKFFRVRVTRQ